MPTVLRIWCISQIDTYLCVQIYLIVSLGKFQARTQVGRVCMHGCHYLLGNCEKNPVSKDLVVTQQAHAGDHTNMGYHRLSPYSAEAYVKRLKGFIKIWQNRQLSMGSYSMTMQPCRIMKMQVPMR